MSEMEDSMMGAAPHTPGGYEFALEQRIEILQEKNERSRETIERYENVLTRIAEVAGVSTPTLIGKAENDDENMAEILARHIEKMNIKEMQSKQKLLVCNDSSDWKHSWMCGECVYCGANMESIVAEMEI